MNPLDEHALHKKKLGCAILYLIIGLTSVFVGIISIIYDFQELALIERIKVRPGLPAFELWKNPSATGLDIGIKVYLFAVENPDEFLSNPKAKMKVKEIGPIVYRKVMHQDDIVFHEENSTMSFSTVFHMEYDDTRTEPGILNRTITVINPMLLAFGSMADSMLLARFAFNLAAKNDHVFINRTLYELLWDNSSPIFDLIKRIPFATPRHNAGVMYNSFYPSENRFNVNIGPRHGFKNFFKINTYNGLPRIDVYKENYPEHCPFSLEGASEGTGLPPHTSKDDVIYAYTRNLCRPYPMVYNETVEVDGIEAYKYVLADEIYTRLEDPDLDCFRKTGDVVLPNGLSDATKCALGLPVAVSNPHFWNYHGVWENYIEGLAPDVSKHSSHVLVEPKSGIQLEGIARIQSNLPMPGLNYFSPDIKRFSNMIVPQFWMEYFMINKQPVIHAMVVVFLALPVIQFLVVISFLTLSVFTIYKSVRLTIDVSKLASKPSKNSEIVFQQKLLLPDSDSCKKVDV